MTKNPVSSTLEQHLQSMPPVQALQLQVTHCTEDEMCLTAPLSANVNDKGCAFGGSLGSVMTLAAWGLFSSHLEMAGQVAEVYVQDSRVRYLAPLYDDLVAVARLSGDDDWESLMETFSRRGKARATLQVEMHDRAGVLCCTLEGRFVALRPRD